MNNVAVARISPAQSKVAVTRNRVRGRDGRREGYHKRVAVNDVLLGAFCVAYGYLAYGEVTGNGYNQNYI